MDELYETISLNNFRHQVAYFLIGAAFLTSCVYYGPGTNLSMLFYTMALLVGVFLLHPLKTVQTVAVRYPVAIGLVALSLLSLVLHHQFLSVSLDSSFAVSIALAVLPLLVLLCLMGDPQRIFRIIFWFGFSFAIYAAGDFLLQQHRAYLPLADPNNFVTLMFLIWVPWLHLRLSRPDTSQISEDLLSGVVSFVFCLALLATASRFAVFVVVFVGLYWLLGAGLRRVDVRPVGFALAGMLMAGVVLAGVHLFTAAPESTVAAVSTDPASAQSVRLVLWDSTWDIIRDTSGWLGSGIYTFSLFYPAVRSVSDQNTSGLFAHNDYLQLWQEGGVLIVLPLLLWVAWLGIMWIRSLSSLQLWSRPHGFLLALGLALLHANVNFTLYILPLAFVLGVVSANAIVLSKDANADAGAPNTLKWLRVPWLACLAALFWVTAVLGLDAFNYAVFSGQKGLPGVAALKRDGAAQVAFAQRSIELNPHRGIPRYALARLREVQATDATLAQQQEIKSLYRDALRVDPWNPTLRHQYAVWLDGNRLKPHAAQMVESALALNPMDADAALLALRLAVDVGDRSAAEQIALDSMQWCELIAQRDPHALNRLGLGISQMLDGDSDAVQASLGKCRQHRAHTRATQRQSAWLRNLFAP